MLVLIAAGCGSPSNEGVATLDEAPATTTTSPDTTTSTGNSSDPQQAALDWAACMRKNGIDVPDPQVDADGGVQVRIGPGAGQQSRGANPGSDAFRAARKECGSPFGSGGGPQLSAADREQLQASMLEFAACMRKNGVDMPDPQVGGGGGFFRVGPGGNGGGVNPNDPDFQKAQKACQSILQDAIPGGGPGGTAVAP
jgi:hypothetical protein